MVTSIDVYVIAVDAWHKIAYDADTIEVSGMRGEYMCPKGLATARGAVLADSFHRARLTWPIFTSAALITGCGGHAALSDEW